MDFGLFQPDWEEKFLHIAVAEGMSEENGKTFHCGIVFDPAKVYAKLNTSAERDFEEFFIPGKKFRLACLRTHMGPGELTDVLAEKFCAEYSDYVGGIIAPFTVAPDKLELLWTDITEHGDSYKESIDKKTYT